MNTYIIENRNGVPVFYWDNGLDNNGHRLRTASWCRDRASATVYSEAEREEFLRRDLLAMPNRFPEGGVWVLLIEPCDNEWHRDAKTSACPDCDTTVGDLMPAPPADVATPHRFDLPLRYRKGEDNLGETDGVAGTIRTTPTPEIGASGYHVLRVWNDWENEKVIDEFAEFVTRAVNAYDANQATIVAQREVVEQMRGAIRKAASKVRANRPDLDAIHEILIAAFEQAKEVK